MFEENVAPIWTHRNNIHRYGDCSGRTCPISSAILSRNGWPTGGLRSTRWPPRSSRSHFPFRRIRHPWGGDMSGIRDLLICGSEKVIDHYRVLLAGAKNERERELYRNRIERERRLLDELKGDSFDRFAA